MSKKSGRQAQVYEENSVSFLIFCPFLSLLVYERLEVFFLYFLVNYLIVPKNQIKRSKIFSPISGHIIGNDIDKLVGTFVDEGTTIFSVADFSKWIVEVQIPENTINQLKIGQNARIFINAVPYMDYQVFEGKVKKISISPVGDFEYNTITYKGIIEITDSNFNNYVDDLLIKPGMRADVKVIIQRDKIIKLFFKGFKKQLLDR